MGGSAGETPKAPLDRSRRRLLVVVAVALVVALLGVLSPLWIRSPQQLAAEAAPPPPTVLTAPVEQRVLRDTVVVRGEVRPMQSVEVTPGVRGEGAAIVTAVKVRPGDRIKAGAVALEVAARPLIVLPGRTPAYRDLKPGAQGKDVAQLQVALRKLGYPTADPAGWFGAGTKDALTRFYADRGYEPLPTTENDQQQVDEAEQQVVAAERAVVDAQDEARELARTPGTTRQQRSAAAKNVTRAQEDLTRARQRLAEVRENTGPMLPQSEYTFLPSFPARVDAMTAAVGSEVVAPLITFAASELVVRATLTEAQRAVCEPGQTVEIAGDEGLSADGEITSIGHEEPADPAGGNGAPPSGVSLLVTPASRLDAKASGQNVRLTIETASSGGAELVVPVTALYAAADGATYVTKRDAEGREQQVVVVPRLSAQGHVAVTVPDGRLQSGDLVTIGLA
ncbi:peptidoglycan-binding protein [Melissospora conviva]|uniref:peptidoglycan-binding protein n=1 Tax=Melissospora conviva TaxID=3388432 RepID=UPI003C299D8B